MANVRKISCEIMRLAGADYASGLIWRPLDQPRTHRRDALALADKEGANAAVFRKGSQLQVGLAHIDKANVNRTYSLAAALAEKLGDDWIGAFDLGSDRYLLIAVTDGDVVPLTDRIGDRTATYDTFVQVMGMYDNWGDHVYAPSDFSVGGRELSLKDALGAGLPSSASRLTALSHFPWVVVGIAATVLIALIGGGVYGYNQWHTARERAAARARIAAYQAKQKMPAPAPAIANPEVKRLPHPWINQPKAMVYANACGALLQHLPLAIGGWLFTDGTCTGAGVTVKYTRDANATLNDFQSALAAAIDPAYVGKRALVPAFDANGNIATFGLALSGLVAGGDDPVASDRDGTIAFKSYFQRMDIDPHLVFVPPPPPPKGKDAKDQPIQDWRTYKFNLAGDVQPDALIADLPQDGLRLTSMEASLNKTSAQLTWKAQGALYVR